MHFSAFHYNQYPPIIDAGTAICTFFALAMLQTPNGSGNKNITEHQYFLNSYFVLTCIRPAMVTCEVDKNLGT